MALLMNFTIELHHEFFIIEQSPATKEEVSSNTYIFFQRYSKFEWFIQRDMSKSCLCILSLFQIILATRAWKYSIEAWPETAFVITYSVFLWFIFHELIPSEQSVHSDFIYNYSFLPTLNSFLKVLLYDSYLDNKKC